MVISKLQPRVSGFFHVAWLCVSAAMAVVGLVNGVFVMIRAAMVGDVYFCSEFGGVSVYFDSASIDKGGDIQLRSSGVRVAYIFSHHPCYADRVAELRCLGLLE